MSDHLIIAPILFPLLIAALILLVERRGDIWSRTLGWVGTVGMLLFSSLLLMHVAASGSQVYLLGDWPARLGIALFADRLSAALVLLVALLGLPALIYASTGWDRRAPHFHAFFQFQLAGLAGAFLTADLFNLFVFFEVMLIASYGLMLSGGKGPRMRAGLHYVVFNVVASSLFLIALGLIYGLVGTLNMAEIGARVAQASPDDVALIQAAAGILLTVFCAKAALLPMFLWLPMTYKFLPAPAAALFVVMTKVGVYSALRVFTVAFGDIPGAEGWPWTWLLPAGLGTLLLATFGAMASQTLRAIVGWMVVASAATLFVVFSLGSADAVAAGLYYLLHSSFAAAALFLIANQMRRQRGREGDRVDCIGVLERPIATGVAFALAAMAITGLPPLSGFVGKLLILQAVPEDRVPWIWVMILLTSWMAIVAFARAGSGLLWEAPARAARWRPESGLPPPPRPRRTTRAQRRLQWLAIWLLLGYGIALVVFASPVYRYLLSAAESALAPSSTVDMIRGVQPVMREPAP
ncbi:monovalent cation/H+ antiporter subunit D [Solilutibacter tolerans]|uniref:Multisubunit potassium/proton antiporter, PhaD subunit n=1 Tax=Solilutibacter tolerans TaxID=1604334 RepID=A0A1N6N603_9GAMM|nr:monovalent cation/H+ antiporter subunit D [Lysobacter tolerans]SIP87461.1 multisubunit potassium/proton antiporter, PhaD subunit [Lysobacter tolerans]